MKNFDRFQRSIFLFPLSCVLILALLSGCASLSQVKSEGKAEEASKEVLTQIERIDLEKEAGLDRVKIVSSKPITYTAFKLTEPVRLVIDVPQVVFKGIETPIAVGDGILREISAQLYQEKAGNIGRIEIGLEEDVEYELELKGNILLVEARKMPVGNEGQMVAVGSAPTEAEVQAEEGLKASEEVEKTLKEAGNILSMDVIEKDTYNLVILKGDGRIGNYNAFTLNNPDRFVLDIWGIKSLIKEREMKVGSPFIKTIRVGEHEESLRFVLDIGGEGFPAYSVDKMGDRLYIIMGDIKIAKAALPEIGKVEEVKKAEIKEAKELPKKEVKKVEGVKPAVKVESVDFKGTEKASVVAVKTSVPAEYELSKSMDGKTVAVIVKDALIPEVLQRTLDTSELKSSVESISSYPSSKELGGVTVLVRLKEGVEPRVERKGNTILMEFPEPARLKVAAAEAPKKEGPPPPAKVEKTEAAKKEVKEEEVKRVSPPPVSKREVVQEEIKEPEKREEALPKETEGKKRYVGKRISLDVKDADIKNIFRLIAEVSELNLVVAEDVAGKVTLRLIDVPWDQALDIILNTKGLGMIQEGNIVRIARAEKLRQEEEAALTLKKAKEKLEDLSIKLVSVNYAEASDLSAKVKDLLTERGTVTVDSRTNTLIIKDIQANIDKAVALISKLDTPTPQVLIEARIVEANKTFARDLGITWSLDAKAIREKAQTSENIALSLPASGSAGSLGTVGFTFGKLGIDPFTLDLQLSAGEVARLSKTIARPRITTLDNKEAKISQGTSIPYQTVSQSGTQTSFVDATLNLTVTPHITPDGRVSLKINASKNSIGETTAAGPTINKKEASTEMLLKDGETAVLGGILETAESDSTEGLPWLMNVPVLGWLFKRESVSRPQTELLIFISPTILKDDKKI